MRRSAASARRASSSPRPRYSNANPSPRFRTCVRAWSATCAGAPTTTPSSRRSSQRRPRAAREGGPMSPDAPAAGGSQVGPMNTVGHDVPRIDAYERVTGRATYTRDVTLPGMLYARGACAARTRTRASCRSIRRVPRRFRGCARSSTTRRTGSRTARAPSREGVSTATRPRTSRSTSGTCSTVRCVTWVSPSRPWPPSTGTSPRRRSASSTSSGRSCPSCSTRSRRRTPTRARGSGPRATSA